MMRAAAVRSAALQEAPDGAARPSSHGAIRSLGPFEATAIAGASAASPAIAFIAIPTMLLATQLPSAAETNPLVQAESTAEALFPLRVLVPLGINPFLALGLLGFAAAHFGIALPSSLSILAHPVLWVSLMVMFLLLWGGRSFKLTKPTAGSSAQRSR